MPRKLGRKSAGAQVAALAQEFADDLLVDEERAFNRVGMVFVRPVPSAVRDLALSDELYRQKLTRSHLACAALTVDIATELGRVAISKGLASVGEELKVCELTLPTRYRGVAELAVQAATEAGVEILQRASTEYQHGADAAAGEFEARALLQLGQSADVAEATKRLFSENPAGLTGFGGRGVWWWTVSDLNAGLRAVSIRCANHARISAMASFNRAAEDRG